MTSGPAFQRLPIEFFDLRPQRPALAANKLAANVEHAEAAAEHAVAERE
jgi:hypothetical protein